jgi:hypothetical protein
MFLIGYVTGFLCALMLVLVILFWPEVKKTNRGFCRWMREAYDDARDRLR